MGTSGENVNAVMAHSKLESPLEIMKRQLKWRHICPTAPDTLRSYPFEDDDPFVLTNCPNVYFVGGQKEFMTDVVQSPNIIVRLIAVPKFALTRSLALLDIDTLEAFHICLAQK